jgi:hypothetical protein
MKNLFDIIKLYASKQDKVLLVNCIDDFLKNQLNSEGILFDDFNFTFDESDFIYLIDDFIFKYSSFNSQALNFINNDFEKYKLILFSNDFFSNFNTVYPKSMNSANELEFALKTVWDMQHNSYILFKLPDNITIDKFDKNNLFEKINYFKLNDDSYYIIKKN